ncbi:MAG: peptide chain release factor N(5)-glutamine methyltransferase [Chitinophagales bacterium]|nr:peptide chain release factor N(5)-glutamine methyltransferase [Chitinophagales bacterium]
MNFSDFHQYIIQEIKFAWDEQEAVSIAKIILEKIYNQSFVKIWIAHPAVSEDLLEYVQIILNRLKEHEPIQYIFSEAYFYGHVLYVNENVLIPRPETEELVDWVLQSHQIPDLRVLDIGTGSGCIPVTMKNARPDWHLTAWDVSKEALFVAKENALYLEADMEFVLDDIRNPKNAYGKWDIIVSNPPYITLHERVLMPRQVIDFEPSLALFVEENPLEFYTAIIDFANKHLEKLGWLYFEVNEFYGENVEVLMKQYGYSQVELKKDMFGKNRMLRGQRK